MKTEAARRLAIAATFAVVLGAVVAAANIDVVVDFINRNDGVFKLIGLAIGPFLAVLAFIWGRVDKTEMSELALELGKAEGRAEEAQKAADAARKDAEDKLTRIKVLERDLRVIADSRRLWQLRLNQPFAQYNNWKSDSRGAKIVTIGLFKGGVGKTHLAANFAAYVSETKGKPVLLVDLDYQGSLSTNVLSFAGYEPPETEPVDQRSVNELFDEGANLATLCAQRIQLCNHGPYTTLNSGRGLSRAWIVPANYTLNDIESDLLVDRAVNQRDVLDERYRLAHVLLDPDVRNEYALIIIDTPPRMTLGTVNALVASHSYIVPTILDRVSSEAVAPFFRQIMQLRRDLRLTDLRLAGVVGTLARTMELNSSEVRFREEISDTVAFETGLQGDVILKQHLPRKTQVTNQEDLGYFLRDDVGLLRERFYDAIFEDLWERIHAPRPAD